jgi:hypothetical protein
LHVRMREHRFNSMAQPALGRATWFPGVWLSSCFNSSRSMLGNQQLEKMNHSALSRSALVPPPKQTLVRLTRQSLDLNH